jgi:hypothetical protein
LKTVKNSGDPFEMASKGRKRPKCPRVGLREEETRSLGSGFRAFCSSKITWQIDRQSQILQKY